MGIAFQPSFDDLSTPLFDVSFCVLDLETTGATPADCEITEIGAVRYQGGECIGSFQTLVDPGLPIPPSITILTGITQAMVMDAPTIETALPSFLEFISDSVIVGHNVRFDLSFLNAAAMRLGYERLGNQSVDTAALARRVVRPEVRNLRLQTLAAHFRSPVQPNHRALEDARATAHVLHGLLERVGSLGVTNLDDLLQLPTARGSAHYAKIGLTEDLPRRPGVYIFKDANGNVIYVGKASNLRARVRQYFYGDKRRMVANMMKELASIDVQVCDTLIEAEITEVRLIHAHKPRHNRRSRTPKASHFVKLTDERFPRLSIVRKVREDGLAYLGPFRSKRSADMVAMAIWDAVPIRRCHARSTTQTGKCAAAQVGVASCPCDGTLPDADYASIVARLLAGLEEDPALLLEPLVERMARMSHARRYEEAAWLRDRHDALARAIQRRQAWLALVGAGAFEAENPDGTRVVVDRGMLVETRAPGRPAGILSPLSKRNPFESAQSEGVSSPAPLTQVPATVQEAEEADLIWKWITNSGVRLVDATGTLALPRRPVVRLTVGSRVAA